MRFTLIVEYISEELRILVYGMAVPLLYVLYRIFGFCYVILLKHLQTLTNALSAELGKDELNLRSKVLELSCSCNENSPMENWSLSYASSSDSHLKEQSFDAVIMTVSRFSI